MSNEPQTSELVIPGDAEMTAAFPIWLAACQKIINDYFAKNLANLKPPTLEARLGGRFIIITKREPHSNGAYAFIDTTGGLIDKAPHQRGDVLKPASWRKPARHARGNLFDADKGMKHIGVYGPAYLK